MKPGIKIKLKTLSKNIIQGCDLIIDSTANSNFSLFLNEIAIIEKKPFVCSTAYRNGKIGRIIIRKEKGDPCIACYSNTSHYSKENFPLIPIGPEEKFLEDGCGEPTEEASGVFVEHIANQTVQICLKILAGKRLSGNLLLSVIEEIPEDSFFKEGNIWRENSSIPTCIICNEKETK